jgi:DNA end-binding protein Ku
MSDTWQPSDYHDSYTERVKDLIAAKRKGKQFAVADEAPQPTNVVDLLSVLQASVDAARSGRTATAKKSPAKRATGRTAKKATANKAPAKKATAKKVPAKKAPAKRSAAKKATARKAS